MQAHQPLQTHQGAIPHIGILVRHELDQAGLAALLRYELLCLVAR